MMESREQYDISFPLNIIFNYNRHQNSPYYESFSRFDLIQAHRVGKLHAKNNDQSVFTEMPEIAFLPPLRILTIKEQRLAYRLPPRYRLNIFENIEKKGLKETDKEKKDSIVKNN